MNLLCLSRCGVCNDENHKVEVNALLERIVARLQQARDDPYPCTDNMKRVSCDFRWDQGLSKLKKQSRDIHNLWKQIGRPRTGLINAERLRIKCLYKKGIADRKLTFENDRKKWLVYKLSCGDSRGFWKGWR